ncbi:hypothetical protein A2U01_0080435, partial [Trifolium medium]|nr:hypothetical protein [Trifolium medium]
MKKENERLKERNEKEKEEAVRTDQRVKVTWIVVNIYRVEVVTVGDGH